MKEYEFTLDFRLIDDGVAIDDRLERLFEEGCDDSLPGIGQPGWIALMFTRDAESAHAAITSALADARRAMPDARLAEVSPDLVGLTDIADIMGFTRQNMRKLMFGRHGGGPAPSHAGKPSLWHLTHVLEWLAKQKGYPVDEGLMELAEVAMQLNLAVQMANANPRVQRQLEAALA